VTTSPDTAPGKECPRCRRSNPAHAKFCLGCGGSFVLTCTRCATALPADASFCLECGQPVGTPAAPRHVSPEAYTPKHLAEKILTSKAALEGERKQVTVLFADLKGSMELLANRDPEEARRLLDPVLELMIEAVHRYEGTVNQVMGDGIMALFGAPVAHEDHAARACYAALSMQESVKRYAEEARHAHGVSIQIRVGLNSGEVVVRAIGSDLHMDYTAVGQTTHLAARMEQLAAPGTTLLAPSTLALVEELVAVTSLGLRSIKGVAEPLEVFDLTGAGQARTRLQAAARRGLTQFVGRHNEAEQLRRAHELAAKGHGQVVAVVGEAGVGKSRLVYEFARSQRREGLKVLEAASVSYGKGISYLPVIDLLTNYFEIDNRDELGNVQEKVTSRVLDLDRALEPILPALRALLDLPVQDQAWDKLAPHARRQRTLDAVRRLLLREAREQFLVVIFEDLHWIDGETQSFLDRFVESLNSARLLLIVDYRPEYQHSWAGKTYYSQVRLDPLPVDTSGSLLDSLLGDDSGLAPLKELLVKRGNPFFLEETVQALVETRVLAGKPGQYQLTQPVRTIQVPPTVQAMLEARIDRLDAEYKRLLQIASVIGKDVPHSLLQAIADLSDDVLHRGLDNLQTLEFLYESSLYPNLEYSFKHALTHEVAYGGLLEERRRALHARIVDAIEAQHADRLNEHLEQLAHHAHHGALGEKAVRYLRRAGLKAADRTALKDARTWFEAALEVLRKMPNDRPFLEQACDIRLELRPILTQLGEISAGTTLLREVETFAERLQDELRRTRAAVYMIGQHSQQGELDDALRGGYRVLETTDQLGDLGLHIQATSYLQVAHYLAGEFETVVHLALRNLATLTADWGSEHLGVLRTGVGGLPITSVHDRWLLIRSLAELGRFVEGETHRAEIIKLADLSQNPHTVGMAHFAVGTLHSIKGEWAQARAFLERGIELSVAGNALLLLPPNVAECAWVLAQLGEQKDAVRRLQEGRERLARHIGVGGMGTSGRTYCALGRACLKLGRSDDAREFVTRALECSPGQKSVAAHAEHLLGDIARHPDRSDLDASEMHYRKALELAESLRMRPLGAHCHLGLGRLHSRIGKRQEAQDHLTVARTMYREMDMRFWLEQAEAELKELA